MFKILIWDYAGISAQWLEQVADMRDIEVVGTIKPSEPVPKLLLETDKWNWLLIFEQQGMRNFFNATINALNLPLDKVVYALDLNSWLQRPKAVYTLLNDSGGGNSSSP